MIDTSTLAHGQRFQYRDRNGTPRGIYRLQKLPDFQLWILIFETNGNHWMAPQPSPLLAFGGCEQQFSQYA